MATTGDLIAALKQEVYTELLGKIEGEVERLYKKRIECATLSSTEAASYLGVCKEFLYTMVREEQIKAIRMSSSKAKRPNYRFRLSTLDKWMEEQEGRYEKGESA
ncbi:hypothetical protein PDENDC454_04164 [Paenibacillus dendritiformis C454]|uniref:Helix-turn-helix domain-containing protein n=1 Tax=Paenibacillus dendritiformis C454 TaxID=1131935 RepID=H3SBE7_9BACL|nr:helix-turn-helix domain-containing protein [Paenibacillus dendritiformis]EHQ63630.1 hypothetical protein PDENDC454_04164 [Paenibacillus dendritiformis C454]